MNLMQGIFYHGVGASSASLCYTPQKKVVGWSWQTYWLAQATVCWFILPVLVAYITIPQLRTVLHEAPGSAMWTSFLLGMAYGIGGTAFGIAIRYVGFSLTYAIAVGISCVLGTLLPPLVAGTLGQVMQSAGSSLLMGGVAMGAMGIALCGWAGKSKEQDMGVDGARQSGFHMAKGFALCIVAGVLSALYGFSLNQGQPIADVAARHGAGQFQGNVIYIFSNTGAFVSTLLYCLYLHNKEKTFSEFSSISVGRLSINYLLSLLTGIMWYFQFFFYGLGHVRMGKYEFSSWAIHMIMLVLISTVVGMLLKEWKNCSKKTILLLVVAIAILLVAVVLLTYGNKIGNAS